MKKWVRNYYKLLSLPLLVGWIFLVVFKAPESYTEEDSLQLGWLRTLGIIWQPRILVGLKACSRSCVHKDLDSWSEICVRETECQELVTRMIPDVQDRSGASGM